ncbi:DNA polymerase I [Jeotgalicoccus aerolatus]|uniref:DNA polymerase I n=1 Tax=Jeotgalicoccus aerolatus TaxID=709510 RepID=A0ABS4HNS2_9STAP|nr:DNA polymerase I [Jeotgalicoccus aerolatus]MBP1952508.1 DNA polymerase-1 [Jeotgalicoccus aerolatus]GGD93109.1 DNA polymerase [Jeotgalicoccus aerolatus]CAD2074732.1 DNA polymerase I [Jeotgalicoccus aerolatus]
MAKLILMDGNSIAFRAFYGLPLLTNQSGLHTNAIFGYARLLEKIIKEEEPDYFLVAFDAGKSTFRHKQYTEYKGGRQKTPPELGEQFAPIRQLIDTYGIKRFEHEDYEADDIIGTWTKLADEEKFETIVITGDKDLTQLASDYTKVYITKKGVTDIEVYTPEHVSEVYDGLKPLQIIDLKGLMGDKSDNIPGVPGVGEKTAVKLLKEYDSVENVLDNLDNITGKKLNENLTNNKETALMSKALATIYRDMTFDFDLEDLKFTSEDSKEKYDLFKELEFNSMLDNMEASEAEDAAAFTAERTDSLNDFGEDISIYLEVHTENYLRAKPEFIGIADKNFVLVKEAGEFDSDELSQFLNTRNSVTTYDLKRQVALLNHLDVEFDQFTEDIMLGSFLLNPSKKIIDVAETAGLFNVSINSDDFHYGKGRNKKTPEAAETKDFVADKVQAIDTVAEPMADQLKKDEMYDLLHDLEIPLSKVLVQMELKGIMIKKERLKEMEAELSEKLTAIEEKIYGLAGETFNINSPKQLGVILFEKLELPVIKKTKTGYSTAVDVLEQLQDKHEIIDYILNYRTISKLQSTYVIGLQAEVSEDSRIHTRFNQTLAQTGRLSSVEPNLQNIPIRLEEGRKIRQAFVPSKAGNVLLGLDYSQIELRVLAAITKDESMVEAFTNDIDIHTKTAMEVYGVELDEVTPLMRRNAKAVNFGIVYGISDYGLSQNLGITRKEAASFIETYLNSFKEVKQFMHDIVQDAKRDGYVSTLLHRRRYVPDVNSRNFNARSFAERTAMNSPIQGSAADIIKLAMVKYAESEEAQKFNAELLLQIHDELIFDIPEDEVEDFIPVIKDIMENAIDIDVPLKVDAGYGTDWYEVK